MESIISDRNGGKCAQRGGGGWRTSCDLRRMTQAIGWTAAAVLLVTIVWQVGKQWREQTSRGVSVWLFVGQIAANALFLTYAVLTREVVFMVANALLLITSLLGLILKVHHARKWVPEAD